MAASNEDWSTVSQDAIDVVVCRLKRTEHWSRHIRSLRALNKHWCRALDRHIVEVRPASSRVITGDDIDSLSKFQNLTALDTAMFEGYGDAQMKSRCLKLVKVASKLPHLKRLRCKDFLHHVEVTALQSLSSIKEIEIEESKILGSDVLSKISELEIESLDGCFSISALNDFIPKMPSLKVLSMGKNSSGSMRDFQQLIPKTNAIQAVSLIIPADLMDPTIAEMHNLVSLKIYEGCPITLEPLVGLLKLTSLDFCVESKEILTSTDFQCISKRLVSLIIFQYEPFLLPNDFLDEAKQLETLSLELSFIDDGFLENLKKLSLSSLALLRCNTFEPWILSPSISSLKHLTLQTDSCSPMAWILSHKNLTSLSVDLRTNVDSEIMNELVHLTLLESLEIIHPCTNSFTNQGDLEIKDFTPLRNLRSLKLSGMSIPDFDALPELKLATELEKLTLEGNIFPEECPDEARYIRDIQKNAPDLKVYCNLTERSDSYDSDPY